MAMRRRKPRDGAPKHLFSKRRPVEFTMTGMLLFLPTTILAEAAAASAQVVFLFAALAIVPLSALLGRATEEYAAPFGLMRSRAVANPDRTVRLALTVALLRRGEWAPAVADPPASMLPIVVVVAVPPWARLVAAPPMLLLAAEPRADASPPSPPAPAPPAPPFPPVAVRLPAVAFTVPPLVGPVAPGPPIAAPPTISPNATPPVAVPPRPAPPGPATPPTAAPLSPSAASRLSALLTVIRAQA